MRHLTPATCHHDPTVRAAPARCRGSDSVPELTSIDRCAANARPARFLEIGADLGAAPTTSRVGAGTAATYRFLDLNLESDDLDAAWIAERRRSRVRSVRPGCAATPGSGTSAATAVQCRRC
jgi:hypothetical protein